MPYKDRTKQKVITTRLNKQQLAKKMAIVNAQKAGRDCYDCGAVVGIAWPATSFDFDHIDPAKKLFKLSGSVIRSRNEEEILGEIAKCVLRCSNCHRARTSKEGHFMARPNT